MQVYVPAKTGQSCAPEDLSSLVQGQSFPVITLENVVRVQRFALPAGQTPEVIRLDYHLTLHQQGRVKLDSRHGGHKQPVRNVYPGLIHFRPALEPHESQWSAPAGFTVIGLHHRLLEDCALHLFDKDLKQLPLRVALAQEDAFLWQVGGQLAKVAQHPLAPRLYLEQLAQTIATHVLFSYQAAAGLPPTARDNALSSYRLRKLEEFIADNITRQITLTELAAVAGISKFYFARCFQKATGQSPARFVLEKRMQYARKLLEQHSVTSTAFLLGYANPSHFTEAFRSVFGLTPSQYQQQLN